MEDAHSHWGDREGKKDGSSQDGGGRRKSLLLWSRREEFSGKPEGGVEGVAVQGQKSH